MRMGIRVLGLGITSFFMMALSGCGTQVCAMGVGNCQQMYANAPSLGTSGLLNATNNLTINGPSAAIGTNQRTKFTASGGTPAAVTVNSPTGYQWTFIPPGATSTTTQTSTAAIAQDGTFVSTAAGQFRITATDSANQTASFVVTVQ